MTKTRSSVTVTAVGYAKAIRDVSSFVRQRVGSSYSKRSIGTPDDHAASIRAIAEQVRARAGTKLATRPRARCEPSSGRPASSRISSCGSDDNAQHKAGRWVIGGDHVVEGSKVAMQDATPCARLMPKAVEAPINSLSPGQVLKECGNTRRDPGPPAAARLEFEFRGLVGHTQAGQGDVLLAGVFNNQS